MTSQPSHHALQKWMESLVLSPEGLCHETEKNQYPHRTYTYSVLLSNKNLTSHGYMPPQLPPVFLSSPSLLYALAYCALPLSCTAQPHSSQQVDDAFHPSFHITLVIGHE
jgi:hypothetical protein